MSQLTALSTVCFVLDAHKALADDRPASARAHRLLLTTKCSQAENAQKEPAFVSRNRFPIPFQAYASNSAARHAYDSAGKRVRKLFGSVTSNATTAAWDFTAVKETVYLPGGYEVVRNLNTADTEGVDLLANLREAGTHAHDQLSKFPWFYDLVRLKGPWDYKQMGKAFQAFGNFNYGATGTAARIDEETLLRAAGYAQMRAGNSKPEFGNPLGGPPYGDDPTDQFWIKAGIQFAKNPRLRFEFDGSQIFPPRR